MAKEKEAPVCTVLYTVYEDERGKGKIRLCVEKWNDGAPKLTKRGLYEKDGEMRVTKAEGLTKEDWNVINSTPHIENIDHILNGKE